MKNTTVAGDMTDFKSCTILCTGRYTQSEKLLHMSALSTALPTLDELDQICRRPHLEGAGLSHSQEGHWGPPAEGVTGLVALKWLSWYDCHELTNLS